jgi:membrane protease YdiL (CAAX protease family)
VRRDPAKTIAWLALTGSLAAIAYASRVAGGTPDRDVLYRYEVAIGSIVQYGLMLGLVLWIGRGLPKRELFALRRPQTGFWATAGLVVLTLGVIIAVSALLEQVANAGEEQGLTPDHWDPSRAGAYAASFVAVAVVAPIVEELTYRGEGFTLLSAYARWVAIVGTGLAFALGHGLLVGLPVLLVFGLGLAWLRDRTDSVYPGIVLHSIFNGAALIAAVTIGTS